MIVSWRVDLLMIGKKNMVESLIKNHPKQIQVKTIGISQFLNFHINSTSLKPQAFRDRLLNPPGGDRRSSSINSCKVPRFESQKNYQKWELHIEITKILHSRTIP